MQILPGVVMVYKAQRLVDFVVRFYTPFIGIHALWGLTAKAHVMLVCIILR